MDKNRRAKEIISNILYATVATVTPEGQPWNSPVYFSYDEAFNIYWASWTENIHSQNVRANKQAFIVIYDSTVPEGKGESVYIQATVEELSDSQEIEKVLVHYYGRKNKQPRKAEEFLGDYPRRIYKATPHRVWMNDGGEVNGNFVDIREEVKL